MILSLVFLAVSFPHQIGILIHCAVRRNTINQLLDDVYGYFYRVQEYTVFSMASWYVAKYIICIQKVSPRNHVRRSAVLENSPLRLGLIICTAVKEEMSLHISVQDRLLPHDSCTSSVQKTSDYLLRGHSIWLSLQTGTVHAHPNQYDCFLTGG